MKIRTTEVFDTWLSGLRDGTARGIITRRIKRLEAGNSGQSNSVGDGIVELKIDHGPGYRVYYRQRGSVLLVILCGGDKSTQAKDIARAKQLASEWEDTDAA